MILSYNFKNIYSYLCLFILTLFNRMDGNYLAIKLMFDGLRYLQVTKKINRKKSGGGGDL